MRTVLYADPDVASYLKENAVLHWSSERPAPRLTVDYGDGRKIVRTITGNSAHYVMTSDGRVVDCLPGLYDAGSFKAALEPALRVAADDPNDHKLVAFHTKKANQLNETYTASYMRSMHEAEAARAELANRVGMTKSGIENRVVRNIVKSVNEIRELPAQYFKSLRIINNERGDDAIYPLEIEFGRMIDGEPIVVNPHRAMLSESSLAVIRRQLPDLADEERTKLVDKLRASLYQDTCMSEGRNHTMVSYFFVEGRPNASNFDTINEYVFDKVFLTPASDQWLGLVDENAYTGLENAGIVEEE